MESEENSVPVIIGASGIIKKGLDQNLQLLPGHHINKYQPELARVDIPSL